jgi:type I restriction enzyme S subunit
MVEAEENISTQLTEVGVIPEVWTVKPLKCVADFGSGTTPSRSLSERYFVNGTVHWVKTMDLNNGHLYDTSEKVTDVALREVGSLKVYPPDTVLVAMYGGFNQIGRTGILKIDAAVNQALVAVQAHKNKLDPDYLIHYLNYRVDYWKQVASSSRKDPNITSNDVKLFPIALPPTKDEQTGIAIVLNHFDQLIEQLYTIIKKKEAIKQGVAQKLLTSDQDWKPKKLGDLLDYEQPTQYIVSNTDYNPNALIPVLTPGKSFILGYTNDTKGVFSNLPVIIFDDFTTATKFVQFPFKVKSSALKILKPKTDADLRFLYELMQTIKFDSSDHKRYWISEYQNIEIKVPEPGEQIRIASIISDLNTEIEILKEKHQKYRLMKLGTMQTLLTGKVRLV